MNSEPFANLFELIIDPLPRKLYRGPRYRAEDIETSSTVVSGKYVFSFERNIVCLEPVETTQDILKNILHKYISAAILESDKFFDIQTFSLSGAIAGNLLHKEEVFSIARSFQLQIIFDKNRFYLTVLAGLKIYNRVRLPEVLQLLGTNALSLPQRALCFAGKGSDVRWRDGQILSLSDESCIVRIPSIQPSEIAVSNRRVIPRLSPTTIKRLLHLKGSNTNIEQKLRQLRLGKLKSEGEYAYKSSVAVLREHISTLFPLWLGNSQVKINKEPSYLHNLPARPINKKIRCVSTVNGEEQAFDSIREGLTAISFKQARSYPVAIFCTPRTQERTEKLISALNAPSDTIGGFQGMAKHFGISLEPLPDALYVVQDVEEYIDSARAFVLSPDPMKKSALAFISLSEEDETYASPVPLYYRLKALLARTGHPSQVISNETLTNKYARWNLALNIAAKLGAIPWTLERGSSLQPVDLFLGFSFSSIRTEQLGQSRNIAYVNVFNGDGTWQVFCADANVFSFQERFNVFPRIASEAIRSATDNPESLHLIEVHYNKRFGFRERKAIASGVQSLAPQASINFVSIADEHPVRFFDPINKQMSCSRGTVLQPSNNTAYVQTIEADTWSGFPKPLRLQIYRDFSSIAEDSLAVSERILALTRLNWRSIRDYSSLPVTILYSSLVARLTNYFSLTDWKDIDHDLKRTPWFL